MTASTSRKYNPGFLTDDELVASFCIRTNELESLVEMLRDCTGDSNRHQIVIGPRGSGKTMLLLRVAAEVRRNTDLARSFFPIVFAEESYEVGTAGELWLECLARLADQAPHREDTPDLRRTFEDLRNISDDQSLEERCLAALLDFSDLEGKRLVLLVENLNMMIADIGDRDAGWRLRKVLQTEPRIVLIASATSRFDEIDHPDHAMYDLLRTLTLRPLSTDQCAVLWETVSGQSRPLGTIRSLEILTGGSPRLLAIVARFGTGLSFRELMDNLLDLVDDHTEYFKSHLEALPPQERRVYLALADLWKPALTKEIAARARLETSKCSAQLARLIKRGVVLVAGGSARRKQYYLSERLYNIYYLLRRNRRPNRLIEALILFMASYYSPDELKDIGTRIVEDAKDALPEARTLYELAHAKLMALPALADHGAEVADVVRSAEGEYGQKQLAGSLLMRGVWLSVQGDVEDALAVFEEVVRLFRESEVSAVLEVVERALFGKAVTLGALNRRYEELAAYEQYLQRADTSAAPASHEHVATALFNKGKALGALGRPEEELAAYEEVVHRFGKSDAPVLRECVGSALLNKAYTLGTLGRPKEEVAAYDEVLRRFGRSDTPALVQQVAKALLNRGFTLGTLGRGEEEVAAYDEVVRRFGQSEVPALAEEVAQALVNKGFRLAALDRPDEGLDAYDEVLRRFGQSSAPFLRRQVARALVNKGLTFHVLDRPKEALAASEEVLRQFGEGNVPPLQEFVAKALVCNGVALGALGRPEEALAASEKALRLFAEQATPALLEQAAKMLVNTLMRISVDLGPAPIQGMIQASSAADFLLPLMTALEQEMGLDPRVAPEVDEVAQDIRRELARLRRDAREIASGHQKPLSS